MFSLGKAPCEAHLFSISSGTPQLGTLAPGIFVSCCSFSAAIIRVWTSSSLMCGCQEGERLFFCYAKQILIKELSCVTWWRSSTHSGCTDIPSSSSLSAVLCQRSPFWDVAKCTDCRTKWLRRGVTRRSYLVLQSVVWLKAYQGHQCRYLGPTVNLKRAQKTSLQSKAIAVESQLIAGSLGSISMVLVWCVLLNC